MIIKVTNNDIIEDLLANYNSAVEENDIPYISLDQEEFEKLFWKSDKDVERYLYYESESKSFVSALIDKRSHKKYISFILVPKHLRRRGIATALLDAIEQELFEITPEVSIIEISFFNPSNIRWYVPDTNKHEHPNAPGVEVGSAAYYFFKNALYRTFAYQNAYHIDLVKFTMPEKMLILERRLESENIKFETFDKNKMTGFDELLKDLGSEIWTRDLTYEISENGQNRPIIVPVHNNKVIGFTGPLDVEVNGRGYFAGIGVHSDYRGKGVAKLLFNYLCLNLQSMNAKYMTLFTGETNPARRIYEAAGFKIVKSWEDMRKEFKEEVRR